MLKLQILKEKRENAAEKKKSFFHWYCLLSSIKRYQSITAQLLVLPVQRIYLAENSLLK